MPQLARQPEKAKQGVRNAPWARAVKSPRIHFACRPGIIAEVKLHLFHLLKNYSVLDMRQAARGAGCP